MIIEPTTGELVFYCVMCGLGLLLIIAARIPWKEIKEHKARKDPYRDCPKEEWEW